MNFLGKSVRCALIISRNLSLTMTRALSSRLGFTDYETEKRTFKVDVPEYYNFAQEIEIWANKEKTGERSLSTPAFWWVNDHGDEVKWSFQDLLQNSNRIANILHDVCELKRSDRVMVVMPRLPEWWLLNLACSRTGTVIIPGTAMLRSKDMLFRLQKSQSKCIVTDPETAVLVDEIADQAPNLRVKVVVGTQDQARKGWISLQHFFNKVPDEHKCVQTRFDEPMKIFFTSGTTGPPKMCQHTHTSFALGSVTGARYWLDLTPDDVYWNSSDTGWAKASFGSLYAPWLQGSCTFIHHSKTFKAKVALNLLRDYPISVLCLPPTGYRMLIQEDMSSNHFNCVRHCASAGEPLNPEVIHKWHNLTGLTIREGFGQTETSMVAAMVPFIPVRPGSLGKPLPGYDLRVIDENLNELGPGNEGNFAIKIRPEEKLTIFTEYLDEPEKNKKAFRGNYYLTGDRGICDEDGYLWFKARNDDIINSAGYRIGPFEVESAILEHPAVVESAVVSSPDPIRGEVVKAFIVLAANFNGDKDKLAKEIQEYVKNITAPYKYPRKIAFVENLPKTISGKIKRVELREKEWKTWKCDN